MSYNTVLEIKIDLTNDHKRGLGSKKVHLELNFIRKSVIFALISAYSQ